MVKTHNLIYPMASGEIEDWDIMEKLWHKCMYDYLRCEPREHIVMLTEPPMNPPNNRESMAEIMFETFGVEGLHIGVQATLALYSSWYNSPEGSPQRKIGLTGTVVDSGDGVTHIIPMVGWG
jgi:actin-related protein 3